MRTCAPILAILLFGLVAVTPTVSASDGPCLENEVHVIVIDGENTIVGQYCCKGSATEPKIIIEDDWAVNPMDECRQVEGSGSEATPLDQQPVPD